MISKFLYEFVNFLRLFFSCFIAKLEEHFKNMQKFFYFFSTSFFFHFLPFFFRFKFNDCISVTFFFSFFGVKFLFFLIFRKIKVNNLLLLCTFIYTIYYTLAKRKKNFIKFKSGKVKLFRNNTH